MKVVPGLEPGIREINDFDVIKIPRANFLLISSEYYKQEDGENYPLHYTTYLDGLAQKILILISICSLHICILIRRLPNEIERLTRAPQPQSMLGQGHIQYRVQIQLLREASNLSRDSKVMWMIFVPSKAETSDGQTDQYICGLRHNSYHLGYA